MRECQSCERPIPEERRRNALYCGRSACRSREYRRRKQAAAQASWAQGKADEHVHAQQDSFIVTCGCGSRLLIQVSQLGREEPARAVETGLSNPPAAEDTTAPPGSPTMQLQNEVKDIQVPVEHSDPVTRDRTRQEQDTPALPSDETAKPAEQPAPTRTALSSSNSITAAPREPALSAPSPPALSASAHEDDLHTRADPLVATSSPTSLPTPVASSDEDGRRSTRFRTCELYGFLAGRAASLAQVLVPHAHGGFDVLPGAEIRLATRPMEGFGLAGTPGRWREHYPDQSPTAFGLDAELAVMFWDERRGRGEVLPANDLRDLLGRRWRERLLRAGSWSL